MSDVTVAQFAEVLKVPVEKLLKQFEEAGIAVGGADAAITDDQKGELLAFLRRSHGRTEEDTASAGPRKITLKRKTQSEIKVNAAQGRARTVSVEVRTKKTYINRGVLEEQARAAQEEIDRVREAEEADAYFEFQLYGAALPFEARQALGMTFEDWQAAADRRWAKNGHALLAFADGRARAALRGTPEQGTLIAEAGRKKVVGQPILYKTTKEFLVQFGLKNLSELPTLKEFEELSRMSVVEETETPQTELPRESEAPAQAEATPESAPDDAPEAAAENA